MKKYILQFGFLLLVLVSCKDDEQRIFDKPADERSAEAIAELKSELTRPPFGWKIKYQPENETGSYWVLLKFENNNEVRIQSDLPQNDGEFFDQTITYRIDSSLGLELIFESYSFFSYLFEQEQATLLAEYEFNYASKTPNNELVFVSKTDPAPRTTILFQEASEADVALLGQAISPNLQKFPSSCRLSYNSRNAAVYFSLDHLRRVAAFNWVSLKSDEAVGQAVNVLTGYYLRGDSIVFEQPLDVTFNGARVYIKSLLLTTIEETPVNICPEPSTAPIYNGLTSLNEGIRIETSLYDNAGAAFRTTADIYAAPVDYMFNENGMSMGAQVRSDIVGADWFLVYNNSGGLNAMGFLVENPDGSTAIVVKEYTATYDGNVIEFTFADDVTIFRPLDPRTNVANVQNYLDLITAGGKTYAYRVNQYFFQLYNPCSGWRYYVQIIQ